MLSPFLAPFVVPWAARTQERLADRAAAELGYGVLPETATPDAPGERSDRRGVSGFLFGGLTRSEVAFLLAVTGRECRLPSVLGSREGKSTIDTVL